MIFGEGATDQTGALLPRLPSSFNIAAFNLNNAIGAWLWAAAVIAHGPGLGAAPRTAARLTVGGLAIVRWSVRLEARQTRVPTLTARMATN